MTNETSPGPPDEGVTRATLALWDYRRRIADLYAEVRSMKAAQGWARWCQERDRLFREHPQSPVPAERRAAFAGIGVWPYDPAFRVTADVIPAAGARIDLPHSGGRVTRAHVFGATEFSLNGLGMRLDLFWLDEYSGGVFLPFRDATSGATTYGGGRYLLDTAKGADLGLDGTRIVLDFNFAYHPSCAHDPRWSCPLAPPGNRLPTAVTAGERLR